MRSYNATTQFSPTHGTLLLAVAMEPKEIGQRIAAARNRKGWTQLVFAMEANVSPSTIQRWESGQLPPVRELMRIADVLEVDVSEFVEPDAPATDQAAEIVRLAAELSAAQVVLARIEKKLDAALPARRRARASG